MIGAILCKILKKFMIFIHSLKCSKSSLKQVLFPDRGLESMLDKYLYNLL